MLDKEVLYCLTKMRPRSCNWRKKRLSDPNLREYKQLMAEIDERKNRCDQINNHIDWVQVKVPYLPDDFIFSTRANALKYHLKIIADPRNPAP